MAPYCPKNKLLAFLIHHDLALLPSLLSPPPNNVHSVPSHQRGYLLLLSMAYLHSLVVIILFRLNLPEVNNHFIQPCHNSTHLHSIGYTPIILRSLSRSFFLEFLSLLSIPMVFCLCLYLYLFYLLPSI